MGEASPHATRWVLAVLLPVAAVLALIYVAWRGQESAPGGASTPAGAGVASAPAAGTAPAPVQPEAATESASKPATEPGAPAVAPRAPAFDVVRVEPDGSAAVVGTAEPGAEVTIFAENQPLAVAEADAAGNFVALFKVEPSAEPRALTLGSTAPGGEATSSAEVVMLLPKAPASPQAEAVPAGAPREPVVAAGGEAAPAEEAPASSEAAVPASAKAAEPEVVATAIVRAEGVELPPPPGDPGAKRRVTLASISYARAGQVTLAGVGTAGAVLRAYVDDRLARETRVAADGRWSLDLSDVARGVYRLRIDQLAADGRVASRVETPFQRDFPPPPPPRPGPGAAVPTPGMVAVTVQPGNNLWTLARERYGSGVMYTQIFTANRAQIRNPDLIYPGQIFSMPEQVE